MKLVKSLSPFVAHCFCACVALLVGIKILLQLPLARAAACGREQVHVDETSNGED